MCEQIYLLDSKYGKTAVLSLFGISANKSIITFYVHRATLLGNHLACSHIQELESNITQLLAGVKCFSHFKSFIKTKSQIAIKTQFSAHTLMWLWRGRSWCAGALKLWGWGLRGLITEVLYWWWEGEQHSQRSHSEGLRWGGSHRRYEAPVNHWPVFEVSKNKAHESNESQANIVASLPLMTRCFVSSCIQCILCPVKINMDKMIIDQVSKTHK